MVESGQDNDVGHVLERAKDLLYIRIMLCEGHADINTHTNILGRNGVLPHHANKHISNRIR